MAYFISDLKVGAQLIEESRTVAQNASETLLSTVKAFDPTYGEGEFIYLIGVASTAVGDAVVYSSTGQTTRTLAASRGPVAIAMSANGAGARGWYQIRGLAVVNAATVVAETAAQLTATDGRLDDTTTATNYVDGAVWKGATGTPAANLAICAINYPVAQGR
jgi:hypothetical protein